MSDHLIIKSDDYSIHINNKYIRCFDETGEMLIKIDISDMLDVCLDIPTFVRNKIFCDQFKAMDVLINCPIADGLYFTLMKENMIYIIMILDKKMDILHAEFFRSNVI